MNKKSITFICGVAALVFIMSGCTQKEPTTPANTSPIPPPLQQPDISKDTVQEQLSIDFAAMADMFQFSAEIPPGFEVEYIPEIESINIYNPSDEAHSAREQSQIFIRYFKASRFLTLSTVTIFEQEETTSNNHAAVRYDIEKKAGVANFPYQPLWRNERHELIDIRLSGKSPTYFYVIARNPNYPKEEFEHFVNSIVYHSDKASYTSPLLHIKERDIVKPFGKHITPDTSPIQPEKFTGYHTGIDYEIIEGEENIDVPVLAVCGGPLKTKKTAQGYGGLVTQQCTLEDKDILVLYGHLNLDSVLKEAGEFLIPGEEIGYLGKGESTETDGERKHLHLGILNSITEDIRGYGETEEELAQWINPITLIGE